MRWSPPIISPLARHLESTLRARIDQKTKPLGALGRLEEVALQLGLIQGTERPSLRNGTVLVFAGDHGLAQEGVSPYPSDVTAQMVINFLRGGAAINVFSRQHRLPVKVIDAGVAGVLPAHPELLALKVRSGTRNALHEDALTPEEVELCLTRGADVVAGLARSGTNAILPGEMGIGNSSSAALIFSALLGLPLNECIGRGAGHDEVGLSRKREILARVQARHAGVNRPLEGLCAFGGCEIGMMTGAMLAAAASSMVVMVDGYIATAAALVAAKLNPAVLDYCIFAHASAESGHAAALRALKVKPLLDLGLRLGEGTGAVLAWPLVVSASKFLEEMATFESAGVSERT